MMVRIFSAGVNPTPIAPIPPPAQTPRARSAVPPAKAMPALAKGWRQPKRSVIRVEMLPILSRPGLESKMIKGCGNTKAAVDPRIVFCGYIGNSARFQKANELTAADIEKHMPQVTAFFDRHRVGANRLETQHALVERAGLVEVERRKADM